MLRRLCVALLFMLVPAVASADGHRAGFFGGGSYLKASSLGGFHVSGDVVFGDVTTPSKYKYFSLVGDFSLHSGTHDGEDTTIKLFMGGASMKFAASDTSPHVGSVHGLFGGANGGGDTVFVTAIGGAYEFIKHRDGDRQVGFRVQVDGVIPKDGDKFLRASAGVVFRFRK
jgi:hypothetical protein